AWGYVFSLTRWDRRTFAGGETLLMRDAPPNYKRHHAQGDNFYERIPARFNQLLVFDDRLAHGTMTIEGSMDPKQAPIAMVGQIRATSRSGVGPLEEDGARAVVLACARELAERLRPYRDVQGTVAYELHIAADGSVSFLRPLTDNLVTQLTGYEKCEAV